MNLRERASADAQAILNDINGAGTEFFLKPPNKAEIPLKGSYGDIGYLLNTATGEAIEGRTIEASFSLASLFAATPAEPKRGWGFRCIGLTGKEIKLFVVKFEPDQTIGVGRVKLAVNLT
jgi:hypothetical protein